MLYGFYLIGVWIKDGLEIFIPGSIIGMLLLFLCLYFKLIPTNFLEAGTSLLLRHMPLLFIPVTVGVLNFLDLFFSKGIGLFFIAMISTLLVMGVTGLVSQTLIRKKELNS